MINFIIGKMSIQEIQFGPCPYTPLQQDSSVSINVEDGIVMLTTCVGPGGGGDGGTGVSVDEICQLSHPLHGKHTPLSPPGPDMESRQDWTV